MSIPNPHSALAPKAPNKLRLRQIGEAQKLANSAEYSDRKLTRWLYHAPTTDELKALGLEGKSVPDVNAYFRDLAIQKYRNDRSKREVVFNALPGGVYRVDLLDPLPPMPDTARFANVYPKYREELADGLKLILGIGITGPFLDDADLWPHAIIGGASKSGKTTYLYSLLGQLGDRSPSIVRLALADLAATGLSPFERLPHLIAPLAVEIPEVAALAVKVTDEMKARQTFFRSVFEVRKSDGTTITINGFNDLRYWNSFVMSLTPPRPDLTVPRIIFLIDEWKMAMNGTDESKQILDLTAGIMRLGRKWGMRVWLSTQAPSKGPANNPTFPGDILNNADTRIGMVTGAERIYWDIVFRNRSWTADQEQFFPGETPQGRGMVLLGNQAHPFQGLWLNDETDENVTYTSELDRLVGKQVAKWDAKKSQTPASKLLGERSYALATPGIVVIDPSQPGDRAISIRKGELLSSNTDRPKTTSIPSVTGRNREEEPRPTQSAGEEELEDSGLPRMPSQAELLDLSDHILLRALFVWQQEASEQGDDLVGISFRNYQHWLAERGLKAGNTARIIAIMKTLELAGVLSESQFDKRRRLEVLPYSRAVAQLDDWLANGGEAVQENAELVGEDEEDEDDEDDETPSADASSGSGEAARSGYRPLNPNAGDEQAAPRRPDPIGETCEPVATPTSDPATDDDRDMDTDNARCPTQPEIRRFDALTAWRLITRHAAPGDDVSRDIVTKWIHSEGLTAPGTAPIQQTLFNLMRLDLLDFVGQTMSRRMGDFTWREGAAKIVKAETKIKVEAEAVGEDEADADDEGSDEN